MKKNKQRWVIKAGSQMVCLGGLKLMKSWSAQIAELHKNNVEVIWVTSGAIATAREHFKNQINKKIQSKNQILKINEKQALSAIGQPMIMQQYNHTFKKNNLETAQILLTADDLKNRERKNHFKASVETLLSWNIIPIINENDAVATEEIKFGDNDALSALIAIHTKAQKLIILTDVDGLYDKNPKTNPNAVKISKLHQIKKTDISSNLKSKSTLGTGGMYTKLLAAQLAFKNNISTHLVKGDSQNILTAIFQNKPIGTVIQKK